MLVASCDGSCSWCRLIGIFADGTYLLHNLHAYYLAGCFSSSEARIIPFYTGLVLPQRDRAYGRVPVSVDGYCCFVSCILQRACVC